MASKEYIGLARLTQAFQLLKSKFDLKADKTDTAVMTQAEATTGTSTTGRTVSAKVLNDTIADKAAVVKMGTTKQNATSKQLYILY